MKEIGPKGVCIPSIPLGCANEFSPHTLWLSNGLVTHLEYKGQSLNSHLGNKLLTHCNIGGQCKLQALQIDSVAIDYYLQARCWGLDWNVTGQVCRIYERDTYYDIYFSDGIIHIEINACQKRKRNNSM